MASPWKDVPVAPADPLFALNKRFNDDASPLKIGLGVGAYRGDDGKPYVLRVVREAELQLEPEAKEYLPIEGFAPFTEAAVELLYGPLYAENKGRVAKCQAVSGTGALRLAVEVFRLALPKDTTVFLSRPTWPNHPNIFRAVGFPIREYTYWDPKSRGADFEGLKADLAAAPDRSVIVLHLCSHNPTGADLTAAQWDELAPILLHKKHVALFDSAYQGYATGDLDSDAYGFRKCVSIGVEAVAAQSFSKNFGCYAERVGCVSFCCSTPEVARAVQSQLKVAVRPMYSNPVAHGARIVAKILGDQRLKATWQTELKQMSGRMKAMRELLFVELTKLNTPGDWSHITKQVGMFSYTGLTEQQCEWMIANYHVYAFPKDGRISIAGLTPQNCATVAKAIHGAITATTSSL